jgi:leukotriene-A4 hydrolase
VSANFEPFLRAYIDKYKFKSVDTNNFKNFFISYFNESEERDRIADIDWETWLYAPGLPPYTPE